MAYLQSKGNCEEPFHFFRFFLTNSKSKSQTDKVIQEEKDNHLVNCYKQGLYSDYMIRTKGSLVTAFKLHKIIISKSFYLQNLIEKDISVIEINDKNVTQKGLSLCFQYLYSCNLNDLDQKNFYYYSFGYGFNPSMYPFPSGSAPNYPASQSPAYPSGYPAGSAPNFPSGAGSTNGYVNGQAAAASGFPNGQSNSSNGFPAAQGTPTNGFQANGTVPAAPSAQPTPQPSDSQLNDDYVLFLLSVIASANLLQIHDLQQHALQILKSKVNYKNVIMIILHLMDKEYECSGDLRDFLFTFMCSRLVDEIQSEYGLVFLDHLSNERGLLLLVDMVSQLPFEWVKGLIESEYFVIPTDIQRFNFAKLVLEKRKTAGIGARENVLVSFGGQKKGITFVRTKKEAQTPKWK